MYMHTFEKIICFKLFYLKQQIIRHSQSTGEDAKLSCVENELKPTQKHPTTASFENFRRTDDSNDACGGGGEKPVQVTLVVPYPHSSIQNDF
ncbi:hypothetical protein TNCV_1169661 [Trichonephila clavipes]|uniref:Uncharacterized protein n=1 Tax=Trichonephila clavipes TaxID=2585209 RepID=A0A8X6T5C1_TRICX|nr:hypothetical protein TNCV_1169661 [Trichonephila clavipes]